MKVSEPDFGARPSGPIEISRRTVNISPWTTIHEVSEDSSMCSSTNDFYCFPDSTSVLQVHFQHASRCHFLPRRSSVPPSAPCSARRFRREMSSLLISAPRRDLGGCGKVLNGAKTAPPNERMRAVAYRFRWAFGAAAPGCLQEQPVKEQPAAQRMHDEGRE